MKNRKNRTKKTPKQVIKDIVAVLLIVAAAGAAFVAISNTVMIVSTHDLIYELDAITDPEPDCDCIIVLGCGIYGDQPTPFLKDRLDTAIDLYNRGFAPKLLMSGDHGLEDYNEVGVMRNYAMSKGVPSEDIFMDHAGFSTYETMIRAKQIFGVKKAVVVTQEFHLARSVYDCRAFGIEARGVKAINSGYVVLPKNYVRETAARAKDIIWCIIKPAPTYGGAGIDISGNGEVTLD